MALPIAPELKHEIVNAVYGLAGRERAEVVRSYAQLYSISKQAISAIARKAGVRANAVRRDRGTSTLTTEDAHKVAAMLAISKRADGRIPMTVKQAARLLRATGQLGADVSYSTICRELRRHAVSKTDLKRPRPFRRRAVAHPNAEWQTDYTACPQYYFDDHGLHVRDIAMELHKNHPKEIRAIRRHIWMIGVVDRYSGAFFFQFTYAPGESAQDGIAFLIEAMQPKGHPAYQFHGIPARLLADKGSFAKAQMTKRFCKLFGIDLKTHMPGNPRAKGAIEERFAHTEDFNVRLKLDPPRDLVEMNRRAFDYCVEANCTRPFREDLYPEGRTRMQLWSESTRDQLFIPPPREECWEIVRAGMVRRKVEMDGHLRYRRHHYRVPDPDCWGRWVEVCYNPRAYPEVEVTWRDQQDGQARAVWALTPLKLVGAFLEDAVRPGEIRQSAATATQRAMHDIERIAEGWNIRWKGTKDKRIAMPAPVGGASHEWSKHDAEAAEKLVLKSTPGTRRDPINPAVERRLTVVELLQAVRNALGRPLSAHENTQIRTGWPEGCRQAEVEAVLDAISTGTVQRAPTRKEDDDGDRARAASLA